MSERDIVNSCVKDLDMSNIEKAVRQLLTCVIGKVASSDVKKIVVDNGTKYHMMIYLEVHDRDKYRDIVDKILKSLEEASKIDERLRNVISNIKVIDWGSESYILLSKEYVVVKYVLE